MFNQISDQILHENLLKLVQTERVTTTEILKHLREIERRRLFCQYGYGNILDYCVKELKYSESSAYRRIQAMRILKDIPEVEEKIESGEVNLSTLAKTQTLIKAIEKTEIRKVSSSEKQNLIHQIENKTQKEVETLFAEILPEVATPQKDKVISDDRVLLSFSVSKTARAQLQKIEELSGQPHDLEKLFNLMLECTLEKYEKLRGIKLTHSRTAVKSQDDKKVSFKSNSKKAYISIHTKRTIWKRANGQCEFHQKSGQRCHQKRFLQIDHVFPKSKGGGDDLKNLQLLCAAHNLAKGALIQKPMLREVMPTDITKLSLFRL